MLHEVAIIGSTNTIGTESGELCLTWQDATGTRRSQLHSGINSLGSGGRCTVRLKGPSYSPLHCVVHLNQGEATVCRWGGETRLNGNELGESPLYPGDVLSIGPTDMIVEQGALVECLFSDNFSEPTFIADRVKIGSDFANDTSLQGDKAGHSSNAGAIRRALEKLADGVTSHWSSGQQRRETRSCDQHGGANRKAA
jgi:hypothetical protein